MRKTSPKKKTKEYYTKFYIGKKFTLYQTKPNSSSETIIINSKQDSIFTHSTMPFHLDNFTSFLWYFFFSFRLQCMIIWQHFYHWFCNSLSNMASNSSVKSASMFPMSLRTSPVSGGLKVRDLRSLSMSSSPATSS